MSSTFQACPGCDSYVLADTSQCPQCGMILDAAAVAREAELNQGTDLKKQQMYNTCRHCGEQVRQGLVRCWNCNHFMRADLEERYKEMTSQPQRIIFSEGSGVTQDEYLAPEDRSRHQSRKIFDAVDDEDGFSLRDGDSEFDLATGTQATQPVAPQPTAPQPAPAPPQTAAPTQPAEATTKQPVAAPAPAAVQAPADSQKQSAVVEEKANDQKATTSDNKKSKSGQSKSAEAVDDDLASLALSDERETRQRKQEIISEARKRQFLLPCASCGAWLRVREEQSGKTVRCQQCKAPMLVPIMKKKEKTKKDEESAVRLKVAWMDDIKLHTVKPTEVSLKAGSLTKAFHNVDIGFTSDSMLVLTLAAQKKGLFGKSNDSPPEPSAQRKQIREHIQKTGQFAKIPFGDILSMNKDRAASVRLTQPVAEAHESMFAGVNVFGDGQIAVYLPIDGEDGTQLFLSMTLSQWRRFASLATSLDINLDTQRAGVPQDEATDSYLCVLSEVPFKGVRNVEYYQNDPAYTLEIAGYICATCGAGLTEDSRARKKLGGASGKGIAKAKCPKCSNKFGDQKAWKITEKPEATTEEQDEDLSDVLKKPEVSRNYDALQNHIRQHFGKLHSKELSAFSKLRDPEIKLLMAKSASSIAIVTRSMSVRPLTLREGGETLVELVLQLPTDFEISGKALQDPDHAWPLALITRLAELPHRQRAIWGRHIIVPNESPAVPYSKNTVLSGALLIQAEEDYKSYVDEDNRTIRLYNVVLLTKEEMELEQKEGLSTLLNQFEQQDVSLVLDQNRGK